VKVSEIQEKQLSAQPIPPSRRTTQLISAEMEQLLLRCLEKDRNLRPQSALELKTYLLATPRAADWTPHMSNAWWDTYEQKIADVVAVEAPAGSTPLPTVGIDLESRMD